MNPSTIYAKTPCVRILHPPRYRFLGVDVTIHLTTKQTGGRFTMAEGIFPPGIDGGLHLHRNEDESLHVLEGKILVWIAGEENELSAGQSCFIAQKTPHRIRNLTDAPARVMAIYTPGNFDRFIAEVGTPAGRAPTPLRPEAMGAFQRTCERYGLEIIKH